MTAQNTRTEQKKLQHSKLQSVREICEKHFKIPQPNQTGWCWQFFINSRPDHLVADHLASSCLFVVHPAIVCPASDHPNAGRSATGNSSAGHLLGDNPEAGLPVVDNSADIQPIIDFPDADNPAASRPDTVYQAAGHTAINFPDVKVRLTRLLFG